MAFLGSSGEHSVFRLETPLYLRNINMFSFKRWDTRVLLRILWESFLVKSDCRVYTELAWSGPYSFDFYRVTGYRAVIEKSNSVGQFVAGLSAQLSILSLNRSLWNGLLWGFVTCGDYDYGRQALSNNSRSIVLDLKFRYQQFIADTHRRHTYFQGEAQRFWLFLSNFFGCLDFRRREW